MYRSGLLFYAWFCCFLFSLYRLFLSTWVNGLSPIVGGCALHTNDEAWDAERLLCEHYYDYVCIFLIGRGIVNINGKGSQKEAHLLGVGKYRNYWENVHTVGFRYSRFGALVYIGATSRGRF